MRVQLKKKGKKGQAISAIGSKQQKKGRYFTSISQKEYPAVNVEAPGETSAKKSSMASLRERDSKLGSKGFLKIQTIP